MAAPKGNKYAAGNKGGGAPRKYDPKFAKMATKACQAGFTDREVAELLGVSEVTINQWKLQHQDFALAMRVGKAPADDRVESSLYHRAVGYTYDSVKIFLDRDTKKPIYAPYREHVPPDVAACLRWLMVRRPDEWRERQDHTHRFIDNKRTAAGSRRHWRSRKKCHKVGSALDFWRDKAGEVCSFVLEENDDSSARAQKIHYRSVWRSLRSLCVSQSFRATGPELCRPYRRA
jgi:transcriptional regulator with XRE-family HTH domain